MKKIEWNFESKNKSSNGYEDFDEVLRREYTRVKYQELNEKEKQKMIDDVFNIYRTNNVYPITYYNKDGIHDEIKKCINKEVSFDGDVLNLKFNQGSSLCKFLFPNLHKVECKGASNNSMYDRFYDDHKLKRAIKLSLDIKKSCAPSEIRTALELIGGNVATNFKPMNAKALYERYVPKNGVIYDFASGFGGRMLGALSSENNYKYFGVEPCKDTYDGLLKLGEHIEDATNKKGIFKIFNCGSENIECPNGIADFAFSSPPYFNLEKYSDEPTQCYNKFNNIDEWVEGYVRPTIKNIYNILKNDGRYAVNIADF